MAGVCLLFSELLLKNTASPVRAIFSGTLGLLAYFVVSLLLKGATRRELRCMPRSVDDTVWLPAAAFMTYLALLGIMWKRILMTEGIKE